MKEILLSRGRVSIVDDDDYDRVNAHKWHAHFDGTNWYARRSVTVMHGSRATRRQRMEQLHRFILGAKTGVMVDHVNGDGLDNRRDNLRFATARQNQHNSKPSAHSSQYKGVSWHRRIAKWQAQIRLSGRKKCLGYFLEEERAARAYDAAAREHFGAFARVNFTGEVGT